MKCKLNTEAKRLEDILNAKPTGNRYVKPTETCPIKYSVEDMTLNRTDLMDEYKITGEFFYRFVCECDDYYEALQNAYKQIYNFIYRGLYEELLNIQHDMFACDYRSVKKRLSNLIKIYGGHGE